MENNVSDTPDVGIPKADLAQTWDTLQEMGDSFWVMLPNYIISLVIFIVFIFISSRVRRVVRHLSRSRKLANVGLVLGRIAQWILLLIGFLIAMTIALPSLKPADVLSVLGITGIAIGFAFKDILQNFLAGILILLRSNFQIGDQIIFKSYEGTVEEIDTRVTILRTYDGRKVLIPNGELFVNSIIVNTAYRLRRSEAIIRIDLSADTYKASEVILGAIRSIPDVAVTPEPDTIVSEFTDSSINILARWWNGTTNAQVRSVQNQVLLAIHQALRVANITMPVQAISLVTESKNG